MKITNNAKFEYSIDFCNGNIAESFLDVSNYVVCIDKRVLFFHHEYLKTIIENSINYIVIDLSEKNKTTETVNDILEFLFESGVDKTTTLISIGGGVCGDICGYVSSIYIRGIDYISIPTTLLSQVDSSVGGKVGVNYNNQKNMIGAIYFPKKVIIDKSFLSTLTIRQFKEGLAEVIKHGLLVDKTIIEKINGFKDIKQLKNSDITDIIKLSIEAKLKIVEKDLFDTGYRHALNFGHTFAHAIELNNDLYHGEAVFWGMLVAVFDTSIYSDVKALFEKFECMRKIENFDLTLINNDKKSLGSVIREVFLNDLNDFEIKEVDIKNLIMKYENAYNKIKSEVKYSPGRFIFKNQKLKGEVTIPPSKSQLHRYLIASALSKEVVVLKGVSSICDDIATTIEALKQLNCSVQFSNNSLIVKPKSYHKSIVNMKESATSLRMLLPLLMHYNNEVEIDGENNLKTRPINEYLKIFNKQNIAYDYNDTLPLKVRGSISPDVFAIDGNVSSQYVSGLLFLLPLLKSSSKIILIDKLQSLPYVQMSLKVLKDFGIEIYYNNDYTVFNIPGNQTYTSKGEYLVEQDYSARSFFEVAKSFPMHEIRVTNNINDTIQGDAIVAKIIKEEQSMVDITDIPDAALILAVYYAVNGGVIENIERLKYKESNRLNAICDFLDVMGISYTLENNRLSITKGYIRGGVFNTHLDHRVAMAIIIASSIATSDTYLLEIKSINKSFPTFIECYEDLGGFVDEE